MRLAYAHLCDHITIDIHGKPSFIGVFGTFRVRGDSRKPWEPVTCGRAIIAADLRMSASDPEKFPLVFRLLTADMSEVHRYDLELQTLPTEPGLERENLGFVQLEGFQVPDFGDYTWEFSVGAEKMGEIPMYVRETPMLKIT